ncbi:MAG: GNAT superfamily N-acetyltransferase [Pseudohongiellaceae bacterium]|jgi:GNAT superfamily N-acetyltransferase
MSQLHCKFPNLKVTKPYGLSPRLFFQVYSGANAIAFAQLSSRTSKRQRVAESGSPQDNVLGVSYCLRNIEVSHHYRNQGVGSALLAEVIDFCKQERVSSLYGEAKGDLAALRKWYKGEGFELDDINNIELHLSK